MVFYSAGGAEMAVFGFAGHLEWKVKDILEHEYGPSLEREGGRHLSIWYVGVGRDRLREGGRNGR